MSSFKDHEGEKSEVFREAISSGRVAAFCAAVGADPSRGVPPTFLTIGRAGEFGMLDRMGVPLSRVLHGEQAYSYENPLQAGDELSYQTTLTQVMEKRGSTGGLVFFIFETEFTANRAGQAVRIGSARTNLLTRR